jgi:hypothetical protein
MTGVDVDRDLGVTVGGGQVPREGAGDIGQCLPCRRPWVPVPAQRRKKGGRERRGGGEKAEEEKKEKSTHRFPKRKKINWEGGETSSWKK